MSTVIVGSGTSVLDYEAGEFIDDFDNVVRFHGFDEAPEEHVDHVGSKVTSVVMNTNIETARTARQKLCDNVFESYGVEKFYVTWTRKRSLRRALRHVKDALWNYDICEHDFVRRALGRYSYDRGLDEFEVEDDLSSGIIVVAKKLFREEVDDLWIHGFDALEMETVPPKHYYEAEEININRIHDLQNEAIVLREMVESGDVKKLSDHI